jgi:hypothetical protein
MLQTSSVLAARGPATPVLSCSGAPPLLPTPSVGDGRPPTRIHCGYCGKDGHPDSDCFKNKRDICNRERTSSVGTRASPSTPCTVSLTEQNIVNVKCLLAASGFRQVLQAL